LFVEALRDRNIPAVWGNATEPEVLIQARIRDDRAFVIATPQTLQVRSMVETSRTLNPTIEIVVRNHNADEAERLEKEGVGTVFVGESELANATVRQVLELVKAPAGAPR
jgi:CPA2 family monovalent cation:H+ antiporter-2